jgi:hypothetical protein
VLCGAETWTIQEKFSNEFNAVEVDFWSRFLKSTNAEITRIVVVKVKTSLGTLSKNFVGIELV